MLSAWSPCMLMGADRARFTIAITTGARQPDVTYRISCINARPADADAVNVLAPVAAAARHAVRALCSDSTHMNSVSTSPLCTYSLNLSTIMVCGVIGYAATTSTSDCFTAYATASSPLSASTFCLATAIFVSASPYSRTIFMASRRHSLAHMPHPLQYL